MMVARRSRLDHLDGGGRADRRRLADAYVELRCRRRFQHLGDAVVLPLIEHLGGDQDTLARTAALRLVDSDLHGHALLLGHGGTAFTPIKSLDLIARK